MVTAFGQLIDPIADKLLILGMMFVFAYFGLYAVECVLVIATREILVTVTRIIRLKRGEVLPAEWAGKIKVGFQIGSIALSFWYLMLLDSVFFTSIESTLIPVFQFLNYSGIAMAVALTVISGILFFRRLEA